MRKLITITLFFLLLMRLGAQSVDLSPEGDGTVNLKGELPWSYGKDLSGYLRVWTVNTSGYDDVPEEPGLAKSITAMQKQLSSELVPVNFTSGILSVGLSLKADLLSVQETGFFDLWETVKNSPVVRVFLYNSRVIKAIKPGLVLAAQDSGDFFTWKLGLEYAPWVYIGLDQELSSAAVGHPSYDTPKTQNNYSGSSSHAWGALIKTGLVYEGFYLDLENKWEGTLYEYQYLNLGGSKAFQKSWLVDGFFNFNIAWDKFEFNSLVPRIGVGFDWNGSFDQAPGVPGVYETKWRFNMGFKTRENAQN